MLYIGLMSGTSADGIDAVMIEVDTEAVSLLHQFHHPYPAVVRDQTLQLMQAETVVINQLIEYHGKLAKLAAKLVNDLLQQHQLSSADITAIGYHGQTIRHLPDADIAASLQLGNPALLAELTGCQIVADFRSADIAAGGQGAPLVPLFHQALFSNTEINRAVVNIGGISNITRLAANQEQAIIGFDCGPGNCLLDSWIVKQRGQDYDENGSWAATGEIDHDLVNALLDDPYFKRPPPKSTGREYFNLEWLNQYLSQSDVEISAVDVQASLTELTAQTIVDDIKRWAKDSQQLIICGGGVANKTLIQQIQTKLEGIEVISSAALGVDPQSIEAAAFGWLAHRRLNQLTANSPSVTGASRELVLGAVWQPN